MYYLKVLKVEVHCCDDVEGKMFKILPVLGVVVIIWPSAVGFD